MRNDALTKSLKSAVDNAKKVQSVASTLGKEAQAAKGLLSPDEAEELYRKK
jgi:hypothetical protein